MSFPKFRDYVDSGTAWLGLLPAHWRVDRLKRSITSCRNGIWGNDVAGDGNDLPCVRVADFDRTRLIVDLDQPTLRNVTPKEQEGRILKKNNLLLEKSGGGELQPVGCVVLYQDEASAVCSNFVAKVELAPGMYPSFWRYVHAAAYAVRLNTRSIKQNTGIQNLDHQQYFDERAPFPPFSEQEAIASFLDQETSKIDALISEQQRLIELLKEKRQAVISHAVTKGLNPDVRMKPSGVEWLGEVPEHWEVTRIKHIKSRDSNAFVDGPFGSNLKSEHFIEGGDVYVIESSFATQGRLEPEDLKTITTEHFLTVKRSETRGGDIIIAKIGAQFGKSSILPDLDKPALVSGNSLKLTVDDSVCEVEFVNFFLTYLKNVGALDLIVNATAQPALSLGDMNDLHMLLPTKFEQKAIVTELASKLKQLEDLNEAISHSVTILTERRTALISAAVTGKIDVRNYAATQKDAA